MSSSLPDSEIGVRAVNIGRGPGFMPAITAGWERRNMHWTFYFYSLLMFCFHLGINASYEVFSFNHHHFETSDKRDNHFIQTKRDSTLAIR